MTALVVGCSSLVRNEIEAALDLCRFDKVYCVKQIGIYWPEADFVWVSLHPEFMDAYARQREALGLSNNYEVVVPPDKELGSAGWTYGKTRGRRVSYRWPGMTSSASSGIYGAKVALEEDGHDRVVLAGIPMSADAGHFMPETKNGHGMVRGKVWTQHGAFVCGFNAAIPYMMGKVKSMSGYTRKIFGAPTPEWLSARPEKPIEAEAVLPG